MCDSISGLHVDAIPHCSLAFCHQLPLAHAYRTSALHLLLTGHPLRVYEQLSDIYIPPAPPPLANPVVVELVALAPYQQLTSDRVVY
ncbi:hypothetical protein SeLEV6574_g06627 [Synchytrium endobioticum]|uniref:Uncharacterized protein n=1 Tax=Synchytrium endobioticum TaxID=286115 RepID=A0A507CMP0_9FUNG|nr:hypothetical protein SeLEV6574_g06627 [Synchytrium endobioticum]